MACGSPTPAAASGRCQPLPASGPACSVRRTRRSERLDPEVEHGLRVEPAVLRPPRADPVVASQQLARHLAVVRFPRIGQGVAAQHGQVEQHHEHDQPEAVALEQRAAVVVVPQAKLAPGAEHRDRHPQEHGRHQRGHGDHLLRDHTGDGQAHHDDEHHDACQQLPELRQQRPERGLSHDDVRVVVEGADHVHQTAGGDEHPDHADRNAERPVPVRRHEQERHDCAGQRDERAAHRMKGVAFRFVVLFGFGDRFFFFFASRHRNSRRRLYRRPTSQGNHWQHFPAVGRAGQARPAMRPAVRSGVGAGCSSPRTRWKRSSPRPRTWG